MATLSVDLPIENGDFPCYVSVSLPEGNSLRTGKWPIDF